MIEPREVETYPTMGPVIESSQQPWIDFAYLHPDDFPPVAAKKHDLRRVLFSGGFEITDDDQETLVWYGDKSATSAVRMQMPNPFGAKIVRPNFAMGQLQAA